MKEGEHVLDWEFFDRIPSEKLDESVLGRLIADSPVVDPLTSRILMRQAYQQTYGIYDYIGQREYEQGAGDPSRHRPFSRTELHLPEDTYAFSFAADAMKTYVNAKIQKWFGISFLEFIDLPHHRVREMIKVAESFTAEESKLAAPTIQDIEDTLKKGQQ